MAELSEAERRKLVSGVALEGSDGYGIVAETSTASQDFAAAASATVTSSAPDMSLSSAVVDGLTATASAPAERHAEYAEAQRAIFERSRGRGGAANLQYMTDGMDSIGGAQVNEYNRTVDGLMQQKAARDAARAAYLRSVQPDPVEQAPASLPASTQGSVDYLRSINDVADGGASNYANPELWSGGTDDKDINVPVGRYIGPGGSFTGENTVSEVMVEDYAAGGNFVEYMDPGYAYAQQFEDHMGEGGGFAAAIFQSGTQSVEFPKRVTESLAAGGVPRNIAQQMGADIARAYAPLYAQVEPDYQPQTYENVYTRPTLTAPGSTWQGGRWDAQVGQGPLTADDFARQYGFTP